MNAHPVKLLDQVCNLIRMKHPDRLSKMHNWPLSNGCQIVIKESHPNDFAY